MAAKRNASGLSALPRPSLDNEELVRNGDHRMDVDEDQRKPDQICNSLKRADKGVSGQNPGGQQFLRDELGISKRALPALLYWIGRVEGGRWPGLDWSRELQIYSDNNICTAAPPPFPTVFANNQILRTPSIALGVFSTQKREIPLKDTTFQFSGFKGFKKSKFFAI